MTCKHCGKSHSAKEHYEIKRKLSDKGFPTHDRNYKSAHEKANKKEKEKYGEKNYKALGKYVSKAAKHELLGKNTQKGKIEVSSKVPKKYRDEVAYHEQVESKNLRSASRGKKTKAWVSQEKINYT